MMKQWLMIFFFCVPLAQAISTRDLSFEDLANAEMAKEPVKMRGFLYSKDNMWILSATPNLRSCCLATGQEKQVMLEGNFLPIYQQNIVTVEGLLVYKYPFYWLKQARIIPTQEANVPIVTIFIAVLTLVMIYILLRKFC